MPERIPLPRSSSLVAITYDESTATLDVEFRHGEAYRYFLVPLSLVAGLVEAPSAGGFLNKEIKPRFKEQRLS